MNRRAIFAIVRKDLKVASQNKGVLVPFIVLAVVFYVLVPWLTRLVPLFEDAAGDMLSGVDKLLTRMPAGFQQEFSGLNLPQTLIVYLLKYQMAPMFLLVPLLVALTIAADSFAGEKERKTMASDVGARAACPCPARHPDDRAGHRGICHCRRRCGMGFHCQRPGPCHAILRPPRLLPGTGWRQV